MANPQSLSRDAVDIWQAGVDAVRPERLMANVIQRQGDSLAVCGQTFRLADLDRLAVVGAGKAGAGMAAAVEEILGNDVVDQKVTGWVNVPADCVRKLRRIELRAARPAGVNEPTVEGVAGSEKILEIAASLMSRDLCLVLISGGGSALLPAPIPQITLADKQAVTRFLMGAGATIAELNTVRKQLSRVKGGGLGRAIRAGKTFTLIISDVVGDPLDIIASGPTVADPGTAADALAVLERFSASPPAVPAAVFLALRAREHEPAPGPPISETLSNHVIGSNAVALSAAAARARELGYAVHSLGSANQGEANQVGREFAELCLEIRDRGQPVRAPACCLSGGEPVVHLAQTDRPRKGGRNQQLALAALDRLWETDLDRLVVLSGGTDGEDGPTDAAGAWIDSQVQQSARDKGLDPRAFLTINDAYHFFEQAGGLLRTGPTHTNVMDLRVALVGT